MSVLPLFYSVWVNASFVLEVQICVHKMVIQGLIARFELSSMWLQRQYTLNH